MANPFVHVELATHDLPKAKQFYSSLFGWQLQDMPMPEGKSYTLINVGDGTGGVSVVEPQHTVVTQRPLYRAGHRTGGRRRPHEAHPGRLPVRVATPASPKGPDQLV
jgi:catechol 2,3-dioxygenase-like lactoylglutathione lyase family enzyme